MDPEDWRDVVSGAHRRVSEAVYRYEGTIAQLLGDGVLAGNIVICPWHGWQFDVTTGASPVIKTVSVDKFEVAVEGSDVKVKVN